MIVQYALEIYGLENGVQNTYWHTRYMLMYNFNDNVTEKYEYLLTWGDFIAYKIDTNWYMVKDGFFSGHDKWFNHFSEEELKECIMTDLVADLLEKINNPDSVENGEEGDG